MKPKIMIAGAIATVAALCVLGAAAYSLASQGQAGQHTCSVSGYVVDEYGKGLPGLDVTLHVIGYDTSTGNAKELYTMAMRTSDVPNAGQFAFGGVRMPGDNVTAYASTSATINGTTFSGRSNDHALKANCSIPGSIALATWAPTEGDQPPYSVLVGHAIDANGNPLPGANARVHVMGHNASTGAIEELFNQSYDRMLMVTDNQSIAGAFACNAFVPKGAEYAYVEASVQDNGTTLYGQSDNFTIEAGGAVFADVACVPSPATKAIVVIHALPQPLDMFTINGHVVDAHGNGVPNASVMFHIIAYNASSEASEEMYSMTRQAADGQYAGLFRFESVVPAAPGSTSLLCYVNASITKGDAIYAGRSDNFTMKANDTVDTRIGIPME